MSNYRNNVFLRGEGRSPWYRLDGSKFDCYLVGVAGGSASGKTSVAVRIIENLNVPWVVLLSMDSFYKELSLEKKIEAQNNNYNFDHPDAFDFDLLLYTLKNMKEGKKTEIPVYDFITHSRTSQKNSLYGANVVIFEGIFALYDQRIMDLMDLKEMVNEH